MSQRRPGRLALPAWLAPVATSAALVAAAIACAVSAGRAGLAFPARLNLVDPPLAAVPPVLEPAGPPLSRRVLLLVIDGLGADGAADLPALDSLRQRGVDAIASSHIPTLSRPNYVSILTGVPPAESGVRSNEYGRPVALDSLFLRLRAVGRETAFAADEATGVGYAFPGQLSDASLTPWTGGLDRAGALALGRRYPLVILIADAVDRAGHAHGAASAAYRDAARAVDADLGLLLGELDLTRDTVIVTADHGHTRRGGHGGVEPSVMRVPLVMAGAGVRRGARVEGAQLIDIAPTAAALLGAAAPGHGLGRTLVEALAVGGERAASLHRADERRLARNRAVVEASQRDRAPRLGGQLRRLGAALAFLLVGALAAAAAARLGGLRIDRWTWLLAAAGYPAALIALLATTGGDVSLSALSSRAGAENGFLWAAVSCAAAHLPLALLILRRQGGPVDRLAAAAGLAVAGLLLAHVAPLAADALLGDPPWFALPSPTALFLVPALHVALALYGMGLALVLFLEIVVFLARVGLPEAVRAAESSPSRHAREPRAPQWWARLLS